MACFRSSRPPAASRWVAQKRWSENWESIKDYPGGGQGVAKLVSRKSDGQEAFLKAIKRRKDPERRGRFFREATAYDTMKSRGIPCLVESNAHLHDDDEVVLYIVTKFIEGPTLYEWRQAQSMVELDIAARTTRELLVILTMCHASGFVHRDVKPDNIILAEGDPGRPVLLDFGLTFHKAAKHDLETEQGTGARKPFPAPAGTLGGQFPQTRPTVGYFVCCRYSSFSADRPTPERLARRRGSPAPPTQSSGLKRWRVSRAPVFSVYWHCSTERSLRKSQIGSWMLMQCWRNSRR